jgi:hypothetical protein
MNVFDELMAGVRVRVIVRQQTIAPRVARVVREVTETERYVAKLCDMQLRQHAGFINPLGLPMNVWAKVGR